MNLKKILVVSLLYAFVNVTHVNAFNLPSEIVRALENGDTKVISKYFNSSVELVFSEGQGVYSKAQAEQILKTFFNNNGAGNFKYKHLHTINKDNSQYYIGELHTGKGLYRVYIHIKDQNIHQMRIESND